jgi:soluble lytic murein transglycosylase-like protein
MSTHRVTKQMFKDNARHNHWTLLAALAFSESSFKPDAQSGAGALGLMGFMPITWEHWAPDGSSPHEPAVAIRTADNYLKWLIDNTHNPYEALVAYMWGIGNVKKLGVNKAPDIVRDRASAILWGRGLLTGWDGLPDD